jgi:photosystem II stability/assembly factor-like uncharacterized protein
MAHVHGLGIDPADGMLLAGTHHGTFRVGEDGDVGQVGPVQDFMGFTVVGAEHYLASGHPGPGQDGPGNLGLIESTDGGRTWRTASLSGEADFHALEARHGRVYGHSGGVLMVSEDMRTWQQRAAVPLADLAVSPDDPQTVLATTEQGVAVSADEGRNFELVGNHSGPRRGGLIMTGLVGILSAVNTVGVGGCSCDFPRSEVPCPSGRLVRRRVPARPALRCSPSWGARTRSCVARVS